MIGKRAKVVIMHDMLLIIRKQEGQARHTHIMYRANLSHKMLIEYLHELVQKELIIESVDKKRHKIYQLTEKGHDFIQGYSQIKKFFDSYDIE